MEKIKGVLAMEKKKVIFKSKELKNREEVATFLRELANCVEGGKVIFKQGEEEINLVLPDKVILKIKAELKTKPGKIKHALEVELKWHEGKGKEGLFLAHLVKSFLPIRK